MTGVDSSHAVATTGEPMKVRIGYGLGTRTRLHDETYGAVVDALESLGFDSLWLSEKISGEAPDPLVAMAYGGRTDHQAEVRDVGDGPPGSQSRGAREGTGDARDDVGRSAAPCVRTRCRRSDRTAGVRCRTQRACRDLQRDTRGDAEVLDRASRSVTTDRGSTTTGSSCSRRRSGWTCGSAASHRASCGGSAASPTAGFHRSCCRPTPRRDASRSSGSAPNTIARSMTITTAS